MTISRKWQLLQKERPTNKWLIKDTNKTIIRAISEDVEDPRNLKPEELTCLHRLIDFVRYSQDETLNYPENGDYLMPAVGLAANQIGINKNLFYIRIGIEQTSKDTDVEEYAMVNAKITASSNQMCALNSGEGCLSVDKVQEGLVCRHYKIIVSGYDFLQQKQLEMTISGYLAIVFQHEIDHINGKLFYDLINAEEPFSTEKNLILI